MEPKIAITVEATIQAPLQKSWKAWTDPKDIVRWNHASPDWHTPRAENDLRKGGRFSYRMEARDGSMGFDFGGSYDEVLPEQRLAYTIGDGRKVVVSFSEEKNGTRVTEVFEAENEHPAEMQKDGWQSILDNFKKYVEST